MKTLTLLASLALTATASAVEYVTLSPSAPSVAVPSTSVVEIAGFSGTDTLTRSIRLTLSNGDLILMGLSSTYVRGGDGIATSNLLGQKFTQVTTFALDSLGSWNNAGLTIKITSATEINAVGPTNVLVLPENSTGNFDIVLDSSTDLVNWTPFFSQTVTATTAANFYRARLVKTPTP